MPDQVQQLRIYPYDGGQDSTKHPLLISPKDIVDSNNIIYTTYSTKQKRPGITQLFRNRPPGDNHILGMVDYWRLQTQRIVTYDGVDVSAITPDGEEINITGSNVIPVDEVVSFLTFTGLLFVFFSGGQTPIKYWTQVGELQDLDPTGTLPNAPFGRVFLNSLWIPDPTVPGRLLKSKTGDPTDFTNPDALTIDLDVSDGDPDGITAIFPPFFGSLYVAKRYSIYKITPQFLADGSQVFSVSKIIDGVGCISHNAVVAAESMIFFPSDRGIHYLTSTNMLSTVTTTFLSLDIQPIWFEQTNFNRSQYMRAVYDVELNSYILIFPRQGQNFPTDVWGYSVAAQKWYRWREYGQTAIARYVDFTSKKVRTMVGSSTGNFGYMNTAIHKDYGEPFGLFIESGIIAPGDPDLRYQFKAIAPIFVPQLSGTMDITYKINGRKIETLTFKLTSEELGDKLGEDFILGISVLGGLPQVKMEKRRTNGAGNFISMLVEHNPLPSDNFDENFELLGILLEVDEINKVIGEVVA